MGFFVMNTITKEYVEMNTQNSKYKITKNKEDAHSFKKRKSAQNFLGNDTQKILTKAGWAVFSEQELIQKNDSEPIIKASSKVDMGLEDMEKVLKYEGIEVNADLSNYFQVPNIDIIKTIKEFEMFLKKMSDYASVLSKQYTYIEFCKLDYEHKLELYSTDLDLMRRTELSANYVACLKERRRIKDDILILEKLLNSSVQDIINGDLNEFLNKLENRTYSPRVAPELFHSLDSVRVKPKFSYDNIEHEQFDSNNYMLSQTDSLLNLIAGFEPLPDCGD